MGCKRWGRFCRLPNSFFFKDKTRRAGESTRVEWRGAGSSWWRCRFCGVRLPAAMHLFPVSGQDLDCFSMFVFPFCVPRLFVPCFFFLSHSRLVWGGKRPRRLPFPIRCDEIMLCHWLKGHRLVCWGPSFAGGAILRGVAVVDSWRGLRLTGLAVCLVGSWISGETPLSFGIGTLGVAFCWDAGSGWPLPCSPPVNYRFLVPPSTVYSNWCAHHPCSFDKERPCQGPLRSCCPSYRVAIHNESESSCCDGFACFSLLKIYHFLQPRATQLGFCN
ncbi:hypothetical protein F5144DRAFT_194978 [Chaetomium tenue]|uniref:Uncharacterized protein n=1 Tax=Chaetomium tenue TaxID=1854479 RepID=A0ACB7PCH2_9PEZI|nr:hypothetical protein F5144DRAFT_194978 [Chaetomium globosum]